MTPFTHQSSAVNIKAFGQKLSIRKLQECVCQIVKLLETLGTKYTEERRGNGKSLQNQNCFMC
jgi:hypothetical protein